MKNESNPDNLRKLKILGITYSQVQQGIYAIILQDEESGKRLPIAIGQTEAQAIQCRLQDIITPRPLTHDLTVNIMRAFGLELTKVIIQRTPNGIFTADITVSDGSREITIDSRSSDAVALAIRFGTPVYTTADLINQLDTKNSQNEKVSAPNDITILDGISDNQLQEMLDQAVSKEQYELAQRIKNEIDKRNINSNK